MNYQPKNDYTKENHLYIQIAHAYLATSHKRIAYMSSLATDLLIHSETAS